MKFSGHNYNNAVFDSLLDAIKSEIPLEKTASKPTVDLGYTKTTQANFDGIVEEELKFIANELTFAAKEAHVDLNPEDLITFSKQAKQENLKGKKLERAARQYCNSISKTNFSPKGTTKLSSRELIEQANTILPASLPQGEMNLNHKGAFLGQSKNPNSIWDSEALTKMASSDVKFGDEQISESKEKIKKFAESLKRNKPDIDPKTVIRDTVIPSHTQKVAEFNPNLGNNHLSIFSNDRDFNKINSIDNKQLIKQAKQDRQDKKIEDKKDTTIKGVLKADNRSPIDRLFDNLK
jgi:hypothetical protein